MLLLCVWVSVCVPVRVCVHAYGYMGVYVHIYSYFLMLAGVCVHACMRVLRVWVRCFCVCVVVWVVVRVSCTCGVSVCFSVVRCAVQSNYYYYYFFCQFILLVHMIVDGAH